MKKLLAKTLILAYISSTLNFGLISAYHAVYHYLSDAVYHYHEHFHHDDSSEHHHHHDHLLDTFLEATEDKDHDQHDEPLPVPKATFLFDHLAASVNSSPNPFEKCRPGFFSAGFPEDLFFAPPTPPPQPLS